MSSVLLRHSGKRHPRRGGLRFHLFGPLQALVDDEPLPLGPPKQQALLATLLLRLGMSTGSEQLIHALWGTEPPAYAKNLVQKYVSGLRSAFAAVETPGRVPELLWSAGGYRLETGDAWVDLHEYEFLASAGTTLALTGSLHQSAQHLDEARVLVTGPLAEGLDAPILERERVYRDERFLADMELRAEVELDLGRHRNAIPYLYFVLHKHPLQERFIWLLMLALFRSNRGAEALTVYNDYRQRLVTELGTDPGQALQELHRAVLGQDPELMIIRTLPVPGTSEPRRPQDPEPPMLPGDMSTVTA
ncbi:AfsR/SARP family transcriptional regulator [Streptomyces caeruleatus]|uniref:OmpR/PhoB-type domain-containing protein n=1 Tax=Streptomyces caeruleatus TaxID=661399 RepID=A0A124I722_9ACTN|nr:AfsR/SARP family transcriptional regulator [Streptomyces caeruleatus]KUN94859.1 hypothetical protein AQJ67_36125 [Streptomyces caeruleatus]